MWLLVSLAIVFGLAGPTEQARGYAGAASGRMLYGDNDEPITGQWSGGTGGNAWTVHQYANRYVVRTEGRGTYVIGRAVTGAPTPDFPENYMGPGYIGQFSPKEAAPGRLLVNDALAPGPLGPRDARHGGLGCFAIDLYRWTTDELVDLNCRLRSDGSSAGVYQVTDETVTGDALGVTVGMTTWYRDSTGPVFTVRYSHRFTAADVRTTFSWQSLTSNTNVYVKEPRIVAVFGTPDAPIQSGPGHPGCENSGSDGAAGGGSGVWALEPPGLGRLDDGRHWWGLVRSDQRCGLVTVGPGAVSPEHRYHRGGFSFNVVEPFGATGNLVYDDAGYHDYDGPGNATRNFNTWRRDADGAPGIPGYVGACQGSDPQEFCRMPICDTCRANAWEIGRFSGQSGVSIALMGWRASIFIDHYLGRARRIPTSGVRYSQSFRF